MRNALIQVFRGPTPQSEPRFGSQARMTRNSAGGFVFRVDDWARLDRFLILGSEGGSYYASERKLTVDSAGAALRVIGEDGLRAVRRVVVISDSGRAPKNDPALFVLAMAASLGDERTRRAAFRALPVVARTASHLFRFVEYVDGMRGWGRGLRNAVGSWYTARPVSDIAYQAVKYRQRDGWNHRDLLRLAHPRAVGARNALFGWITKGRLAAEPELRLVEGFERVQRADEAAEVAGLVRSYGLTREMLPTGSLGSAEVWEALLDRMPLGALIRNLAVMTRLGLIAPNADATARVVRRLGDAEALEASRLHPVAVLSALLTYRAGRSVRGSGEWRPVGPVLDALEGAFERSFRNAPRTGKRFYLGIDVSSSMRYGEIAGVPGLSPAVAAATLAMVVARREPAYHMAAFAHEMRELEVTALDSLADVVRRTQGLPFGGTDAALPMLDALDRRIEVDVFVVVTDSETWFGQVHPVEALVRYREQMGRPAKLAVVGMTANDFSIADPTDAGMLDVVGFDSATPGLIADFASA